MSEVDAICQFGRRSDSAEIKRFSSNMVQSIENGGQELVRFMEQQSAELWEEKKQNLLRQGELAAVEAFSDREGNPTRMDILQAMNRVSSMLYLVMIGIKAGK
jgi:ethanolamine utilization cobalamin adenosyltransferase